MSAKYFGKYRGTVINNIDPLQIGRILAEAPDFMGQIPLSWAIPCVPCHLTGKAGSSLPKIGAPVWIEFEQGNPDFPIWTGCWFSNAAETPPQLKQGN
jgi:hypothetical protein